MALFPSLSFSHWRKQLLACMPEKWRRRINSHVMPFHLEISGSLGRLLRDGHVVGEIDFDHEQVNAPEKVLLAPHEVPLVVRIPKSWVLMRDITLPLAARENLRQVIGFEMDRFTPFTVDQVYYDYKVKGSDNAGERLNVQVVVVPLRKIQPVLDLLTREGIAVDVITAEGLDESLNFLPKAARPKVNLKRLVKRGFPVLLIFSLVIALMLAPLMQKRKIAIEMQAWENNARKKANAVLKLREQLDQEISALEETRALWTQAPPLVNVLKELTDLLPNDTSLQQLDIKGNEVTMRGLSLQASSLISLLENAPGFDDPHFLSPVTQQRGKELFNLSARIVMPFPLTGEISKTPQAPEDKKTSGRRESAKEKKNQPRRTEGGQP